MSTRRHHAKRLKGKRSFFDRRKNDERKQQSQNSNQSTSSPPVSPNPLPSTPSTISQLAESTISKHWKVIEGNESIDFCKLEKGSDGRHHVAFNVTIQSNLSWSVAYKGKEIPTACEVLDDFPLHLSSQRKVQEILAHLDQVLPCPGNPDEDFVALCKKRGGVMRGERGHGDVIASLDITPVIDPLGNHYEQTVRRIDCIVLCEPSASEYPQRCRVCKLFRNTLRASLCKTSSDDPTATSSHVTYSNLSPQQKDQRLKNLRQSLKTAKQQIRRLESRVQLLIDKEGITLEKEDAEDVLSITNELDATVRDTYPEDTPQRVFWEQQKICNRLKDKRQMKWHPLVLRFALNLKYMSTSAYRAVRQSGVIKLPSERTLSDYTHWTPAQIEFVEVFKEMLDQDLPTADQQYCALSMDEMKIKAGLVFSKRNGTLVGFIDLGSANRDIERFSSSSSNSSDAGRLADQVFVFMARTVFKPSLSAPIAHYFSLNLKGIRFILCIANCI